MEQKLQFDEMQEHLLIDDKPSVYLNQIAEAEWFRRYPFDMLHRLKETEQSPLHHPEGNVWIHTLMVTDEAAAHRTESREPAVFMWAALLHDIGKPAATKLRRGKITAYDHDKIGERLARKFLREFTEDRRFTEKICALVRYHMQLLFVVEKMPYADIKGMKKHTDPEEAALLGYCDRMGRGRSSREKEERNRRLFLEMIQKRGRGL